MKVFTPRRRNWATVLLGAYLLIAPWIFGTFGDEASSANAWIVGTCIVVATLRVPIVSGPAPGDPGIVAIGLSFVAVGLASLGGFLSGELVVRLGVGVAEGTHLNAPSSLSGRPVDSSSTGAQREE